MRKFINHILCLCGAVLMISGCYRNDIAEMHNSLDALDVNGISQQIHQMQATISELQALNQKVVPELETLNKASETIAAQIKDVNEKLAAVGGADTELQAKLVGLQRQYELLEAAYNAVVAANLDGRMKDIEALAESVSGAADKRAAALETAFLSYATLEDLAKLRAAVESIPEMFTEQFDEKLRNSKDLVIAWVSSSDAILQLFEDYFQKSEVDNLINILYDKENLQDDAIAKFHDDAEKLGETLKKTIEDAVNGATKDFSQKIEGINSELNTLRGNVDDLKERIETLEELTDVIGDYSDYRSNLIDDIRAIQAVAGEQGTLTALVNTLKLVLASGEGTYYDLAAIVADLAANTGALGGQEGRIVSLEELYKTFATAEALSTLAGDVKTLGLQINQNKSDIAALVSAVDSFIGKWNDALADTVSENTENIKTLQSERDKLLFAIGVATEGQETGIYKLIADINVAIANWKIGDLRNNVEGINEILRNCHIDGVTGLQECLENIDARLNDIWNVIGNDETLQIGFTIIDALNKLNAMYGNLGNETVAAIVEALNADLAVLRGTGWTEGLDLVSLNNLAIELRSIMDNKEEASVVSALQETVGKIQETLLTLMTKDDFNAKLEDYLLSSNAAATYATIDALSGYVKAFEDLFGKGPEPAEGTVLAKLAFLETAVGSGELDWTSNLTAAVETLHNLIGDKSVADQSTEIATGIVNDLIKTLLGKEGTASEVAALLASFEEEIAKLKNLGVTLAGYNNDGSDREFSYDKINDAVKAVYDKLMAYVALDDCEASKGTFESIAKRFEAIEDILGSDYFSTEYTIKDAIEEIKAVLGDFEEGTNAKGFIDQLSSLYDELKRALIGEGEITDDFSITTLKNRLESLGFADIRNADGKTLQEVLAGLTQQISDIKAYIGDGFADKTLAESLNEMIVFLDQFVLESEFSDKMQEFYNRLTNIINALSGKAEDGSLTDVAEFATLVNNVYNELALISLNGEDPRAADEVIAEIDARIKEIEEQLGDVEIPADLLVKSISEAISVFLDRFSERVEASSVIEDIWNNLVKDLELTGQLTGSAGSIAGKMFGGTTTFTLWYRAYAADIMGIFFDKEEFINNLRNEISRRMNNLDTPHKDTFVNAINDLVRLLNQQIEDAATLAQIKAAISSILGEGYIINDDLTIEGDYLTIAQMSELLVQLNAIVGNRPEDFVAGDDLYDAVNKLYAQFLSAFGTNETEYTTVWEAIADLKVKILGRMGALVNSMVFIPEYDDGKATLPCNSSRTSFGDLTMEYKVNASPRFAERFGTEARKVKGLISSTAQGVKTIEGMATLDTDGVLSVTFNGSQFAGGNIKSYGAAYIAVVLVDLGKDEFTSPFVQLYFNSAD